jgi:Spy/CpxP family protein refolding chaperone
MTSICPLARLTALCAVAALLSLASGASAQGFKWWQADHVIKDLGLTPEQTRSLEDVFQKALPGLKTQKTALDSAEAEFQRLIERGDPAAMEQINIVEAARAELNKSRARMLFNMRQLLTRGQWAKFTALQQAAERQRAAGAAAEPRPNDARPAERGR